VNADFESKTELVIQATGLNLSMPKGVEEIYVCENVQAAWR